jgi:serine/threonine-protein kinase
VSDENPNGGVKVGKGSVVVITVSTGVQQVTVPSVKGEDETSALTALASAGLNPKVRHVYSSVSQGTVTAQQPAGGDHVAKGTTVYVNVSAGAKPVQIPDVTGQPYANAASALKGQGFQVQRADIQSDNPVGTVVSESPQAGNTVPKGTTITLSVSKGPGTTQVPNVKGDTQSVAQSTLKAAGFSVAVIDQPVNDPSQDGLVLSQDPGPNANANPGEVVTITVGQLTNGTPGGDNTGTTTTTSITPG